MGELSRQLRTWRGACIAVLRATLMRFALRCGGIRNALVLNASALADGRDVVEGRAMSHRAACLFAVVLLAFESLAMFADASATAAVASPADPPAQAVATAADAEAAHRSGASMRKRTRAR